MDDLLFLEEGKWIEDLNCKYSDDVFSQPVVFIGDK